MSLLNNRLDAVRYGLVGDNIGANISNRLALVDLITLVASLAPAAVGGPVGVAAATFQLASAAYLYTLKMESVEAIYRADSYGVERWMERLQGLDKEIERQTLIVGEIQGRLIDLNWRYFQGLNVD